MLEFTSQESADRCVRQHGQLYVEGELVTLSKALVTLKFCEDISDAEEDKKSTSSIL